MKKTDLKLSKILLYSGKINTEQLNIAIKEQKKTSQNIGEILVRKGLLTHKDINDALEYQLGFPRVDLSKYEVNLDYVTMIPESVVRKYTLIAIDKKDDKLIVAMIDPLNFFATDDVKLFTKMDLEAVIANKREIEELIDKYYSSESTKKVLEEFVDSFDPVDTSDFEEGEMLEVATAPIVKLLNSIIEQAVKDKASDIHIEPFQTDIRVRFRIDGDLKEIMTLSRNSLSGIITRIKIIGGMNIAEKRIPQDGRIETKINSREIDMRISTLPTVYGEKVVIRLLDRMSFNFNKKSLGLSQKKLKVFENILAQPYGMILITGPTGSGKTTTLYTVLKELNRIEKNIITIEDPVEYKLNGINQVQTNIKSGLTFATGLRSVLRQDPDIVMVGEIRDTETAKIATRAAITGHLVLSTLHTNDSPSTVARMIDMGIEPYLVSSSIIGIISQRLIKLLCPKCKEEYIANDIEKKLLDIPVEETLKLYKAVGCSSCNKGYKGRGAVHEIMPVNENLRRLIDRVSNIDEIRKGALENGMETLLQSASNRAIKGETSYEEVLRVGFTLG